MGRDLVRRTIHVLWDVGMPVLLGASALRVVLSSDLVYQIMAESHIAKCPGLAGRSKAWVFADRLLDLLCDSQIIGVRLTV